MADDKTKEPKEEPKLDETVPGGKYIVNGVEVDAEGKPIGKKKPEPEK